MSGHGVYTWPDRRVFEGQFVKDLKEGPGVFRWYTNHIKGLGRTEENLKECGKQAKAQAKGR